MVLNLMILRTIGFLREKFIFLPSLVRLTFGEGEERAKLNSIVVSTCTNYYAQVGI